MTEADLAVDAVGLRGFLNIAKNSRPIGDRFGLTPGPKREAERVHIGIGAYTGVAEQIPGAAERRTRLQDCVALAGTAALKVVCGADARQTRPDYQYIKMFNRHQGLLAGGAWIRHHALTD